MLTVIDNGVKIQLTAEPHPNQRLNLIIISALLFTAVGAGLSLGWLSARLSIIAIAFIAVLSWGWQYYRQKFDTLVLTGGELIIKHNQISHVAVTGTSQRIAIAPTDNLEIFDNYLTITNQQGNIRCQILGFQQPQHVKIAQAVLQGKSIQMQGKAIKMQSN